MDLDNITIILGAVVIALAIITPWINIFVRRPHLPIVGDDEDENNEEENDGEDASEKALPNISVILTPHDNAAELNRNLPLFLNQDYPGEFKVIVVAWKSDSDDEDVLKRFSSDPHLYTTYIPDSSRYMSRKKLAITIGVKAAKTEWIVMSDITSCPDSDQWLRGIASHCSDGNNLVIGYTRYDEETSDYRRFERLQTDFYLMRETLKGKAYRCNSSCLAFRKSEFIKNEGFRGNLKYLRGEYDFMVNKYAQPMSVALETNPDSWMTEEEPTDKDWHNKRLFYMEDRKHMEHSTRHRIPIITDQLALHLNWIVIIAAIIFSALTQRWILLAAAGFAFLLTIILRTAIAARAFREWLTDIPAWKTIFYEIGMVWHQIIYRIRYKRADKNDFISHKI